MSSSATGSEHPGYGPARKAEDHRTCTWQTWCPKPWVHRFEKRWPWRTAWSRQGLQRLTAAEQWRRFHDFGKRARFAPALWMGGKLVRLYQEMLGHTHTLYRHQNVPRPLFRMAELSTLVIGGTCTSNFKLLLDLDKVAVQKHFLLLRAADDRPPVRDGLYIEYLQDVTSSLRSRKKSHTLMTSLWILHNMSIISSDQDSADGQDLPGGSDDCFCPNICIWCFILVPSALYFGLVAPSLVAHGIFLLPGAQVTNNMAEQRCEHALGGRGGVTVCIGQEKRRFSPATAQHFLSLFNCCNSSQADIDKKHSLGWMSKWVTNLMLSAIGCYV